MSQKTVGEVLKALKLCGSGYHNGACEECPFLKECMPGDEDVLLAAAADTIKNLLSVNAETVARMYQIAELLQDGNITVFVIVHSWREGREVYRINISRFRASDLDKLGKTVFLRRPAAEKAMRRLQHGHK